MDNDILYCAGCEDTILEGNDSHVMDDMTYCGTCALECYDCSTIHSADDSISGYCRDCGTWCRRCDDGMSQNDSCDVGGETWCDDCRSNHTFYCDSCEESYPDDMSYVCTNERNYCEACRDEYLTYCDSCDEYSAEHSPCECNADGNCCNGLSQGRGIHSYDCKPEQGQLNFHGKSSRGLYLGLELECEILGSRNSPDLLHKASAHASIRLEGVARLKHDGSIGRLDGDIVGDDGFEIVTDPHTHLTYRERSDTLWSVIESLRKDYGARAWDTQSCGLHIHISRDGFNNGAHMHRFLSIVYGNSPHLIKFAGRLSEYARFNDVYTVVYDGYDRPKMSMSLKAKLDHRGRHRTQRYSAVNVQNDHTIELRFFKGTMNKAGVLSALDLTQAMVEYTRELRVSDVLAGALTWEWFADYVVSNNGLYPDLYDRLDKIDLVDIKNLPKMNA